MAIGIKTNSVETRLVGVLLMLTVLPTITVGWIAHEILRDHIKTETMSDMERVAEAKHVQLSMVLSRANGRADLFLSDLAAQCGFGMMDRTCAARLMRSYLIAENAVSATLYPKGRAGPLTVGSHSVLHDADTTFKAGQLAAFYGGEPEGNRVYFILATEQISGMRLEISYPSSNLQAIFDRPEELGESGETFLADGQGYFVTQARYSSTQGISHPIHTAPIHTCLGGSSGAVLDVDYRNAKVIHGFRPVPELGSACIMAHIGQAEAFASLRRLEQDWLIATLLFLAFALVVARRVSRKIANPLINLTKIASAYTQGHYTAQADVKGRNEIAELASAFNSMTYQLTSANDLLAEKVVELEEARTGLARTNRALKMQLLCNIKLVYADAEDTLLDEVCKLIVNAGGYRMAWVGFAQHDEERSVLPAAQSGFDEGYLESLHVTWADNELGQGPTGAAIRTGVTRINQDFQTNAPMAPWREAALARGYRSSIALPLRNGGETFGALTIYSEEPDAFNTGEAGLLEDLANELAFGILMQRLRVRNKLAEEALQRSEEKFRLVVEHIPMRIFIKDINSAYVSCNELCARDWGLAPSAIGGMTDFDFHPHELAEQYRADDERVMHSGQPAEMERRYVIGGKELFAHTIKVPFRDKEGRMVGVLGILWDVTERKLAEERLRRSEHDLAEAQSMAHLGSWSLDLVSSELTWSDENYRIFEFEPGKFGASYEAFLDTIHPDDREFVNQAFTGSVKDKKPYDIVHRLLMKDGRVKYVNERCETFYNDAGEPVRSIGTTHDITQLKLVENALRENEERLSLATIHNGVGIWDWNLQTQEMVWDASMYALYHIRREDFSGTEEAWRAALHPDDLERGDREVEDAISGKKPFDTEFRVVWPGGEVRHIKAVAKVFRDERGVPLRMLGINMDITERVEAEAGRRQLSEAMKHSGEAISLTDQNHCYVYANPAFLRLFGYSMDDILGKSVNSVMGIKGLSSGLPDQVFQGADEFGKMTVETYRRAKDGRHIPVLLTLSAVKDNQGRSTYYVANLTDLTELRKMEAELLRQKSFMRQVIDTDPNMIYVKDAAGKIVLANQALADYLGREIPDLIGKEAGELNPNRQEVEEFTATDRLVIEGRREMVSTLSTLRPDGERRWLFSIKRPLIQNDGEVFVLSIAVDITEQKVAEMNLAESYLELQRLSTHLDHLREDERAKIARDLHDEMGALLVALKMRVAWLASKLPADMPLLTEEAGHISALAADLISSMHQIVTELRPNLQEGFGFVATFEDYVKKFQQRTGIECRFVLPEVEMKLDTNRAVTLFRILQESLNNVEKYAMAKRVKIHLTVRDNSLSLVVEDNGVGFDPATRKKGSFGLIGIRERTLMMGGKAKISSTPGKGTKVSVTLPQI